MEPKMGSAARLGVSEELAKSDHTTGYLLSTLFIIYFVRPLPVSLIPNTKDSAREDMLLTHPLLLTHTRTMGV